MNNIEKIFEKEQIKKLTEKKSIPNFRSGDTLKVNVKVSEGDRSRIQAFEGVCIGRKNNGINSSFTVRKISHGEGVERVFPLYSPNISKISIKTKGDVRRAKLYYLRELSGRKARITENKSISKEAKNINLDKEKNKEKTSENKETKDNNKNKED